MIRRVGLISPPIDSETCQMTSSQHFHRLILPSAGIALALIVACGPQEPFKQLKLLDLNGQLVDPLQATDARATVYVFTRTDCPVSNRYAPEIRRLYRKFASQNVAFWLVYLDPEESVETINRHMREYGYKLEALRDLQHDFVKKTGVRVTPEVAVFLPGGRMAYRGRIDDRYVDIGKARPAPTTRDLEEALEAVLDANPVKSPTTDAVGCFILDLQ